AIAAALAPLLAQSPLAPDRSKGAAAVDIAMCKQWLGTLAGPEFEGRGTGQPGFEKAANYVADHFKALGLVARGENDSYFQHVPWQDTAVDLTGTKVEFRRGDEVVHTILAEALVGTATTNVDRSGDVVLVRPTVTVDEPAAGAPAANNRRRSVTIGGLTDLDLKGKIVLVQMPVVADARATAAQARFGAVRELQGKEAAAVMFVQTEPVRGGVRGRSGMGPGGNPAAAGAARSPLDLSFGGADLVAVLTAGGLDPTKLDAQPVLTALPLQAKVQVAVKQTQAPAMNVFAVLPGSDPKLASEYVVIGSHLDHLGRRGDTISPGADDDGSGTTGVMAVARMFAQNPVKPARSILFVCFSGEENGLVGSRWFAEHCPIPLSSIVAELQMDMIGRDEEENVEGNKGERAEDNRNSLHLIGTEKLAPALHALCLAKNEAARFDLEYDQEGMFGRSDHANFARRGVPIAFFFTGLHRDYHRPSDTPDKIHYEKLLRVAVYVYDIAFELATMAGRPEVAPELWAKYRDKASEQPAAPLKQAAATDDKK
ncbi:MAG: M20/M25/M40 family metallo-hydrolase, partial [Planctomycetes bacterium]|nr:M20/M25/M40 family metallo-hydrolase [Planctomycetota bacterium]